MIGKVVQSKYDGHLVLVRADNLKVGDVVTVKKGKTRTQLQNSKYWVYLNWLINNGLKEHGHFSAEALHENLKRHFVSDKKLEKGNLKEISEGSTSTLSTCEFNDYIQMIDDFMLEFFNIDTSEFWNITKED